MPNTIGNCTQDAVAIMAADAMNAINQINEASRDSIGRILKLMDTSINDAADIIGAVKDSTAMINAARDAIGKDYHKNIAQNTVLVIGSAHHLAKKDAAAVSSKTDAAAFMNDARNTTKNSAAAIKL